MKIATENVIICCLVSAIITFFFCGYTAQFWALASPMKLVRFTPVTRSRTVSSTPWTGDQLVARPLLTAPVDCDDDEVGGMNGFGRGNRSTRRKPAPTPLCAPQIPLARPGREPGNLLEPYLVNTEDDQRL
jgi:hypothetical protein